MRNRLSLAVSALCGIMAFGSAVASDEEVVSSSRLTPLPAQVDTETKAEENLTPQAQVAARMAELPAYERRDWDSTSEIAWPEDEVKPKRKVHGEVSASIGTGGYRSGYVSALIPLGENGMLGISIGKTDYGNNRVYDYGWRDHNGYYPYGRRSSSRSLGMSLDMNAERSVSDPLGECPRSSRYGSRACETDVLP